jgi:hypothetical protein
MRKRQVKLLNENMMMDYDDFATQRHVLIQYLHVMIARKDWHGVADVAMDLRELEAEEIGRKTNE